VKIEKQNSSFFSISYTLSEMLHLPF
jgi:hypothetical protein